MHSSKGDILCNRIKDLCKEKGVSVAKMCRDLKISQTTVYGLSSDKHRNGVSTDNAIKMSRYFGNIPVEYFMDCEYQLSEQKEMPVIVDEQIETPSLEGLDDVIIQIVEKLNVMSAVERSRALGYVDSLIASRETVDVPHK